MPVNREVASFLSLSRRQVYAGLAVVLMWVATSGLSWARPPEEPREIREEIPFDDEHFGERIRIGLDAAVQLDIIHDFNAIGMSADDAVAREFITSEIPVGGPAAAVQNRTAVSPNQSTLALWAKAPTPYGNAKALAILDFAKDVFETDFQLYKVWAHLGYLRFGYDYTLLMNSRAIPDTLDFEGPQVLPEVRFSQVSVRLPLGEVGLDGGNLFFQVGIEFSKAQLTVPSSETAVNVRADNQIPSVVGKFIYDSSRANLQLSAVYRRLQAKGENSYEDTLNGWGIYLSGFVRYREKNKFMFGVLGGSGIAAYVDDTSGLNLDAAPISFTDDRLKTVGVVGFWLGYQRFWGFRLRSTATFGYLNAYTDFIDYRYGPTYSADTPDEFIGIFGRTLYSSVNLIWSPKRWFDTGIEYLYGHQEMAPGSSVYESNSGHDHRIQITFRLKIELSR